MRGLTSSPDPSSGEPHVRHRRLMINLHLKLLGWIRRTSKYAQIVFFLCVAQMRGRGLRYNESASPGFLYHAFQSKSPASPGRLGRTCILNFLGEFLCSNYAYMCTFVSFPVGSALRYMLSFVNGF